MTSIRGRLVYEVLRSLETPFAARKPLETQRSHLQRIGRLARMPAGMAVEPAAVGPLRVEWLGPKDASADSALLYLHGGGYTIGWNNMHRALAARIAVAAGLRALLVDYRLAPENPYPAALTDATTAYGWLLHQGLEPGRIALAGDSAGGGLAVALAVALRDQVRPIPGCIVCLSPWLDLTLSGETMKTCAETDPLITWDASVLNVRRYLGQHLAGEPLISPLFADPLGLPPIYIQVGQHEVLLSDSQRFTRSARQAGVEVRAEVWPGMWHVWQAWAPWVPEANRAIRLIGDFVREELGV